MVSLRRKGQGDIPAWDAASLVGSVLGEPGLTVGTRAPRVDVVSGGSSGNCDREERNAACLCDRGQQIFAFTSNMPGAFPTWSQAHFSPKTAANRNKWHRGAEALPSGTSLRV